ncbi:protein-disulfide reductase DsbD family protein [Curvibacter sp. HBC61]|uniref:Protein-disulfide reductase DsbD family protein n=1 Tax=Curvibacter cyanobacteriorum TaxID=3026422 RepID=A0ABT5MZV1_9BURK|nr:thioredoxin family protein [Curvibacter sp. HBC61]MDD0838854.1 protein-disulfide reductase DsbD family protein [Curvibacter sp. HBC61]
MLHTTLFDRRRPERQALRLGTGLGPHLSASLCALVALSGLFAAPASAQLELRPGPHSSSRALSGAASASVTTPRVTAELVALAPQGVGPGQPLWLGLSLRHQPGWHTYWKNPGDSGLPTQLSWQLPAGLSAGEIDWPVPHKIRIGQLANLGYENTVLLPVPVQVSRDWRATGDTLPVRLHAQWLVCREECIPEQADLALDVPVAGSTAAQAPAFAAARAAQPQALKGEHSARVAGQTLSLRIAGLPAAWRGQALELFPEDAEVLDIAAPSPARWDGAVWTTEVPLSAQRSSSPGQLTVVLPSPQAGSPAYRAQLSVQGEWPPVAAPSAVSPALSAALAANQATAARPEPLPASTPVGPLAWALALLGALVGGLVLNLMPCVFPVLAIKLLGFSRHSGADGARALRLQGLAYTTGVVLSFAALGGLMLALRAGGAQLGWGFQLQSPWVVAGLAALFTVIGLNLAGVFEFGHWLPSRVASAQARHPVADAAWSGVLAVAIASPCTAPFMGASLGFAVALPALQALAIFVALGLGMALPYLAVALLPGLSDGLARRLPKPGAWMQTFRQLMAFPMFGTVAWLVWVLGQQSGIDGAGSLLALLVALSALAWALSRPGAGRLGLSAVSAALLLWLGWALGPNLNPPPEAAPSAARNADAPAASGWAPWSEARAQALVAEGRPVFIDFTAAWCVTCQVNKRGTLANAALLKDMADQRVALLRADWTRQDPAITQALKALGRSGVPVYVVLRPGQAPVVLSELLSVAEVRQALALPPT